MKKVGKQQARTLKALSLKTVVNGYLLDVDKEKYMYFNVESLLEGFLVHVGQERMDAMTRGEMRQVLNALKDGSAVKQLQAEVTELKATVRELKATVKEQIKQIKQLSMEG